MQDNDDVDYSSYYYRNFHENPVAGSNTRPRRYVKKGKKEYTNYTDYNDTNSSHVTKSKKKWRFLGVLIIIMCLSATILGADYLSGGYLLAEFDATPALANEGSYYAVCTGLFSDYATAENYANTTYIRGGAGYIINEGTSYRVVASIYRNIDTAEDIKERLSDGLTTASIYNINVNSLDASSMGYKDRAIIRTALAAADIVYSKLYNTSNSYDLETIEDEAVDIVYTELINHINLCRDNAKNISTSNERIKISAELNRILTLLNALKNKVSISSADMRHTYSEILLLSLPVRFSSLSFTEGTAVSFGLPFLGTDTTPSTTSIPAKPDMMSFM